jgi:hypothetical protein
MNQKHLLPLLIFSISAIPACNLFSGLSKPSNDEQYLIAARACLDHGDYSCALSNYQALSDSKNDEKWSESSLTTLAQNGVFSFSDMIGTLGSSRGSGASLASLANLLAQRGKTTSSIRQTIQETYVQNEKIANTRLRGFSKFISSLSMMNSILATVAGADQILTASDIATGGSSCTAATCAGAQCNPSSSLAVLSGAALSSDLGTLNISTTPDLWMLLSAVKIAQIHMDEFSPGTGGGMFDAIDQILNLGSGAAADRCIRAQLIQTLGL